MQQLQEAHQRGDILVLSTCSCTGYYENVSYDILVSLHNHIISSLSLSIVIISIMTAVI